MKLKTNKSTAKRIVSVSKSGTLMRNKMSAQHLCPGKSKRAKKTTDRKEAVNSTDVKRIHKLIPYL